MYEHAPINPVEDEPYKNTNCNKSTVCKEYYFTGFFCIISLHTDIALLDHGLSAFDKLLHVAANLPCVRVVAGTTLSPQQSEHVLQAILVELAPFDAVTHRHSVTVYFLVELHAAKPAQHGGLQQTRCTLSLLGMHRTSPLCVRCAASKLGEGNCEDSTAALHATAARAHTAARVQVTSHL